MAADLAVTSPAAVRNPRRLTFGPAIRLGVPCRSGGSLCSSKTADAQAAYESAHTLLPTLLAGGDYTMFPQHCAEEILRWLHEGDELEG